MSKAKIPASYLQRMGLLSVYRGNYDDKYKLFSWDAIDSCYPECKLYDYCSFEKIGRCTLQVKYIRALSEVIFENFADDLDESTMYRVGIHLVPLYKMLVKLKMEEILVKNYVKDGKVTPILKEIRETIKTIEQMWMVLGLSKTKLRGTHIPSPDEFMPNYYEEMEKQAGGYSTSNLDLVLKKKK